MGANVKEFLRLVEEFVNMIGLQMSGFQDIYEVTENLGEPPSPSPAAPPLSRALSSLQRRECINLHRACKTLSAEESGDYRFRECISCTKPHAQPSGMLCRCTLYQQVFR